MEEVVQGAVSSCCWSVHAQAELLVGCCKAEPPEEWANIVTSLFTCMTLKVAQSL